MAGKVFKAEDYLNGHNIHANSLSITGLHAKYRFQLPDNRLPCPLPGLIEIALPPADRWQPLQPLNAKPVP